MRSTLAAPLPTPPVDLAAVLALLSDAALAEVLDSACVLVRDRRQQAESALSWLRIVLEETKRRGEQG